MTNHFVDGLVAEHGMHDDLPFAGVMDFDLDLDLGLGFGLDLPLVMRLIVLFFIIYIVILKDIENINGGEYV